MVWSTESLKRDKVEKFELTWPIRNPGNVPRFGGEKNSSKGAKNLSADRVELSISRWNVGLSRVSHPCEALLQSKQKPWAQGDLGEPHSLLHCGRAVASHWTSPNLRFFIYKVIKIPVGRVVLKIRLPNMKAWNQDLMQGSWLWIPYLLSPAIKCRGLKTFTLFAVKICVVFLCKTMLVCGLKRQQYPQAYHENKWFPVPTPAPPQFPLPWRYYF